MNEGGSLPQRTEAGKTCAAGSIRRDSISGHREHGGGGRSAPKAKAPSVTRGFQILNGVCQTLIMINRSTGMSTNFGRVPRGGQGS